jgi:hypothetical protein
MPRRLSRQFRGLNLLALALCCSACAAAEKSSAPAAANARNWPHGSDERRDTVQRAHRDHRRQREAAWAGLVV